MTSLLQPGEKVSTYTVEKRPGRVVSDPDRRGGRFFVPCSSQWWRKGRRPRRDSFRQRCYYAESSFRAKVEFKRFVDLAEAARYLRWFMETSWFQHRFPHFRECVVDYVPRAKTCSGGPRHYTTRPMTSPIPNDAEVTSGHITLSNRGMRELGEVVVLHELAHAVLPSGHGHDRRWARTFVEFVGRAMGVQQKRIFMQALRDRRVPLSPVRQATNAGVKKRGDA